MKKLFAVLLSIVLVLSMSTVAFAADKGTITITNAVEGAEYNVYQMLTFKPADESGTKGVYVPVGPWHDFFENSSVVKNYFTVTRDSMGVPNISLKEGVDAVDQTLAQAALQFAEDNAIYYGITATATQTATSSTVEFTDLNLGYYVIDTTVGTMAAITNTNNELTVVEKNEKPDIDKFVQEDSEINNADEGWGKVNDANIGQTVNYKSTITVGLGAVNYIMHDTMEEGLTFDPDSVVVEGATAGEDYTVTTNCDDGCTFEIKFEDSFIEDFAQGETITVTYSATLNENADIVDDGNDNTVYLSCGEKSEWETEPKKTTTYTWKLDVFKYTMDGDSKVSLAGAEFILHDMESNETVTFSKVEGEAVPTYMVDPEGTVTSIITDENGEFEIVGLDEGAYRLVETNPPSGYNKLTRDLDVVITSEYDEESLTATYKINDADPATIEVENKTGGLFPETGGIGTTIFYVVGGLLMLAAVVFLVSKKRMSSFA